MNFNSAMWRTPTNGRCHDSRTGRESYISRSGFLIREKFIALGFFIVCPSPLPPYHNFTLRKEEEVFSPIKKTARTSLCRAVLSQVPCTFRGLSFSFSSCVAAVRFPAEKTCPRPPRTIPEGCVPESMGLAGDFPAARSPTTPVTGRMWSRRPS